MLQTDSIAQTQETGTVEVSAVKAKQKWQPTPAQVLKRLPKDATPAQQDSAIQANIKPAKIRWSKMPDTLHLPGHPVGKSYRDVSLPQYYKESFFSSDSLFHPELNGGRVGVAGAPVPYTVAGDHLITSLLLGCFVLAMIAFSKTQRFIARQVKNFFYMPRGRTTEMMEAGEEIHFQFFFAFQTCLLLALFVFFYTRAYVADVFVLEYYQVIGMYTSAFVLYFVLKAVAYSFCNWVFFDRKKNGQWMKVLLFLVSMQGVALFPIIMLLSYFDVSMKSAIIYVVSVVVLIKLLTLYKSYAIFFRQTGSFLQIILYFCALELVPVFAMWSMFGAANNYLKVNF